MYRVCPSLKESPGHGKLRYPVCVAIMAIIRRSGSSESSRPTVISLFSGCGGKDCGFIRAGFQILWANDLSSAACETYRRNLGQHIVEGDISDISPGDIPDADIVIGGFPCQGFSIVGTRRLDDTRNTLYREMKRIIVAKRPKFFVAENVRGLLNIAGGRVIQSMLNEFRELGYAVDYRLLNALHFGSPQHRERVIIVGNRLGLQNPFPTPHVSRGRKTSRQAYLFTDEPSAPETLRDAIGDIVQLGGLPNHEIDTTWMKRKPEWLSIIRRIAPGQKLCNVRLGPRSVYTWDIPEVFGPITPRERALLICIAQNRRHKEYGPRDGNPLEFETVRALTNGRVKFQEITSLVRKGYLVEKDGTFELKNAFNGIFRRLRWDHPCEAVLTVFHSPRYYIHPQEHRPFSVRELARVQGFNDGFVFYGPLKEQYTQVGNAVPVPLAYAVAREIFQALMLRESESGCQASVYVSHQASTNTLSY